MSVSDAREEQEMELSPRPHLDSKFKHHPVRYLAQSAIAGVVTMVSLSFLGLLTHIGLVAALGATTFMTFTMPHHKSTRPRYLLGGYFMGSVAGIITSYIFSTDGILPLNSVFAIGAIAVGLATLLMVTTNTEHPPAAGMALGIVLQPWDYRTVSYVLGCVCFLCLARTALRRVMIDLT
jgi:CBS-domain-containing membrane protein